MVAVFVDEPLPEWLEGDFDEVLVVVGLGETPPLLWAVVFFGEPEPELLECFVLGAACFEVDVVAVGVEAVVDDVVAGLVLDAAAPDVVVFDFEPLPPQAPTVIAIATEQTTAAIRRIPAPTGIDARDQPSQTTIALEDNCVLLYELCEGGPAARAAAPPDKRPRRPGAHTSLPIRPQSGSPNSSFASS